MTNFPRWLGALTITVTLAAAASATAEPPSPREALEALYHATNGQAWHQNDGWLEDGVHWCDWYGVECQEDDNGDPLFVGLQLPFNNLGGELTEELSLLLFVQAHPQEWLDLSGNNIGGVLAHFPVQTRVVFLADNQLSGPLPEIDPEPVHADKQHLLLARNRFEGAVPDSWSAFDLLTLDLSDNRLVDGHLHAFLAMSRTHGRSLDLTGNRFSGMLTTEILVTRLGRTHRGDAGGGLRLCFNDFEIQDESMHEWIAERHFGGFDAEQCLGVERQAIDAAASGSWYHPERSGEGMVLHLLDNGAPLLYSFSFDPRGKQQWLFEVGRASDFTLRWPRLLETRGNFGQGSHLTEDDEPFLRRLAEWRLDHTGEDRFHLERGYYDLAACDDWGWPGPTMEHAQPETLCGIPTYADRLDYVRLTELAGTTCDNQSDSQHYSGAWYNPEQPGEGFIIEVLPDDRGLIYWFTYAADGSGEQAWMMGDGPIDLNIDVIPSNPQPPTLLIDPVIQPVGATYGPDFDPADVERIDWGWLEIAFHGTDSGHVYFDSNLEAFGSGDYPIERLARPMLAECE